MYLPKNKSLGTKEKKAFSGTRSDDAKQRQRMYNNRRWRNASKTFLNNNPLCVECAKHNKATAARVTDHIVPHKGNYEKFWDVENWQPLCSPCHDAKSAKER